MKKPRGTPSSKDYISGGVRRHRLRRAMALAWLIRHRPDVAAQIELECTKRIPRKKRKLVPHCNISMLPP